MVRPSEHHRFAFPALVVGSTALAIGPWLVRLSEVGPVAAGFWRLFLALPFLFVIASASGRPAHWPGHRLGMISYLFVLAYCAAGLTYWTAVALGL